MNIKQKGFTLVEMAIVLMIAGLLLSAFLGVGSAQLQSSRISSTKQKQETIKLALINFISRNYRIPCPAIATLARGAVGYGVEALNPGTCTGTNINGNVVSGIVPWSSLGLSEENADDGYYHRFTYQVALLSTNTNSSTIAGLKGAISIHTNTPALLGPTTNANPTQNQTNDCTIGGFGVGDFNPCAAVVVIVSHGNNGLGAYNSSGIRNTLPSGADEIENTNDDSKFVIKDFSDNTTNPFDDIIIALSSTNLLTPLTTHGSLQDYTSIMYENISNIKNAVIADAINNKNGDSNPYTFPIPSSLPSLPSISVNDPWGTPYVYTRSINNVNVGTNASLIAFTIMSKGPDKASGNSAKDSDNITFTIYVNQLQDAFIKVN
jgi:prepilin-type N-terminal cleavage/methylation domain-containing protein